MIGPIAAGVPETWQVRTVLPRYPFSGSNSEVLTKVLGSISLFGREKPLDV